MALNLILISLYYNGVPECYLNEDRYSVLGGLRLISPSSSVRFSDGCFLFYLIAICWLLHPPVVTFFLSYTEVCATLVILSIFRMYMWNVTCFTLDGIKCGVCGLG